MLFGVIGISIYYSIPNVGDYTAEEGEKYWDVVSFPLFMSTFVYGIGSFNGVLSNESALKNPRQVEFFFILFYFIFFIFV